MLKLSRSATSSEAAVAAAAAVGTRNTRRIASHLRFEHERYLAFSFTFVLFMLFTYLCNLLFLCYMVLCVVL